MTKNILTAEQIELERSMAQQGKAHWLTRERIMLGGILLLASFMDFFQLGKNGYGSYYPAAIRSMMDNWHNFFFAAYDPGGFVSIDKPPVGFWLEVISAKIFGLNPVSILLPQALCGVFSVLVLYWLVRRYFGMGAGLLAALALAISPISVVTNRNATIDSTLTLTLLIGAWAIIRAAESGRLRWVLISALIVGIGFNIKMMEAYLVVPAFGALYLFTAPRRIWTRFWHLSVALVVLVAVSLTWVTIVDLTPAAQRPYVDSTQNNSALSLALEYNGIDRLLPGSNNPTGAGNAPSSAGSGANSGGNSSQHFSPTSGAPNNALSSAPTPGLLQLFQADLGSQIGWLLPLAFLSLLALARPRKEPGQPQRVRQALLLWGIWLLTASIFFSVATFFHEYYLTVMAPAVAALFGIGLVTMWQDYKQGNWRSWLLPLALAITAGYQIYLLSTYSGWERWLIPLIAIVCALAAVVLASARLVSLLRRKLSNGRVLSAALSVCIVTLLLTPSLWAVYPVLWSTLSDTLVAGPPSNSNNGVIGMIELTNGAHTIIGTKAIGRVSSAHVDPALLRYLVANQGKTKYLVALPASQDIADDLILKTNRPVMALGGFTGSDPVLTASQFAALVKQGIVRYFLLPTSQQPDQVAVITWITQHCSLVHTNLWKSAGTDADGNNYQLSDCASAH